MLNTFAHAGHSHGMDMGDMSYIEHCMPIVVGAGILIIMLVTVIVYLLVAWQPKSAAPQSKAKTKSKK